MKKHFTKMLGLCCALALIFGNYSNVAAQCTNTSAFGTVTAPTSSTTLTISTCNYLEEYSTINSAQAGATYSLTVTAPVDSMTGANGNGYITVRTGTPSGPAIAQGMSPLSVTPTASGTLYAHWTLDAACVTETGTCRTSTITCTSCAPPAPDCLGVPGGSALPGTACDDGDPNTAGDVYQADCSCVGMPVAVNDLCANAINIDCGGTATGSTANATADVAPSCTTGNGTGGGVWYSHTATSTDIINASICGADYDSKIRIYTGSCETLVCVAGNDDNFAACGSSASEVEFAATMGTQYFILVHGFSSEVGNFELNLTCNVVVPVDCNGVPNGPAVVGSSCNDENPATINDVYQADCSCAGIIPPPAPANDNPCTAAIIACGDSLAGTTLSATMSGLAAPLCSTGSLTDVFYALDVEAGTEYTVTVNGADYDGVLVLYSGDCDGTLTELACSDDGFTDNMPEVITFTAASSESILIRTYDWSANDGSFGLSVSATGGCPDECVVGSSCDDGNPATTNDVIQEDCSCAGTIPAPANDLCVDAINIDCGGTASGSTATATADVAPFCSTGDSSGGGVWYKHTANSDNIVRASLCGSDFDSKIRIFSGTCEALECVIGNDDNFAACASSASEVEFAATSGTQYWILVHGFSSSVGNYTLNLTCNVVVPVDCNGVPNGPAVPGTPCDDMNPATLGDVYQEDCSCAGTLPPANDDKCIAFAIACGDTLMGSTLAASADTAVAAPSCATGSLKDLWYALSAQAGVSYNVTVNGADYDGVLSAYTGDCSGSLVEIACSDSGFTDNIAEFITINVASDQIVLIRTYDWSTNGGMFTLSVSADGGCPSEGCNVDGGDIATMNSRSVCVGTGSPKIVNVTLTGSFGQNSIWALANLDNDVIATRPTNANFNLDIYPVGDYRIFHMSYDNTVDLTGVTNSSQLSGCYDLSNPILVRLRPQPDGGTISTTSSTTVCVGDAMADNVNLTRTGLIGEFSAYGVLNVSTNTIILSQAGPNFNFNTYAPDVYRIYSIAFQEGATVTGIVSPSDLKGCFDLSNFIEVTAQNCSPVIMTSSPNPTAGQSFVTFSVANEEYTTVEVYDMSGRQITSLFNQVVEKDVEYRLEFDGQALPNGIYIYRLTTGSEVVINKFMIAK